MDDNLLERFGVHAGPADGVWRVHIAPLKWRDLHWGYHLCAPILLITSVVICFGIHAWWIGDQEQMGALFAGGGEWFAIGLIVLCFAIDQMCRQIFIEVGPEEVKLVNVGRRKSTLQLSCRREDIRDIHINRSNGKLRILLPDQDPIEIRLTPSLAVNDWIASAVIEELHRTRTAPLALRHTTDATLPYASIMQPDETPRSKRNLLIGIAAAIAVLGIVALFTPIWPAALYIFLLAGIPAGIAWGTQKKDYWFF